MSYTVKIQLIIIHSKANGNDFSILLKDGLIPSITTNGNIEEAARQEFSKLTNVDWRWSGLKFHSYKQNDKELVFNYTANVLKDFVKLENAAFERIELIKGEPYHDSLAEILMTWK